MHIGTHFRHLNKYNALDVKFIIHMIIFEAFSQFFIISMIVSFHYICHTEDSIAHQSVYDIIFTYR